MASGEGAGRGGRHAVTEAPSRRTIPFGDRQRRGAATRPDPVLSYSSTPATRVLLAALLTAALAQAAPPRVVRTDPAPDAVDLAAGTRELVVTFDQPMARAGWSVVGGGSHFPRDAGAMGWRDAGAMGWRDARTFVWPVQLRADQDYAVQLNHACCQGFTNVAGEPAVPFHLTFSTAQAPGARPTTRLNEQALTTLRTGLDDADAHRDLAGVDWDARFAAYTPALLASASPGGFARTARALLAAAPDAHRWLSVGATVYAPRTEPPAPNVVPARLPGLVGAWSDTNEVVSTGTLADGVAYLRVAAWDAGSRAAVPALRRLLAGAPHALVLDVRENSGGDEALAQALAGCFVGRDTVYAQATIREGAAWSGPFPRTLAPAPACTFPAARTAVLTGPAVASSAESFLLMLRAASATLVGAPSAGSSGRPVPHRLGNGVTAWLPSWIDAAPDGTPVEGHGVLPDHAVAFPDGTPDDPVLAAALAVLAP